MPSHELASFAAWRLRRCSSHCTRVNFVTREAKQGVPQSKMMKLVNHASEEIHRVYQRLVVADVREELNAIKFPVAAAPVPPSDDSPAHPPIERRGERKSSQTHHSEDGTKAA